MIPLGVLAARRPAAGGSPITYSVVDTLDGSASVTGSGPYVATVSGVDFGTAASDRTIVICYAAKGTGSATISGVTIGGVTADIDATMADRYSHVIARAAVPTGTSGAVTVTMSQNVGNFSIVAYRLVGAPVAVADVALHAADVSPVTLDLPDAVADGVAVAIAYNRFGGVVDWTGATEDYRPYQSFASTATSGPTYMSTPVDTASNVQGLAVAYKGA